MRHSGAVYTARFSPADSSLIVTASFDRTARIWKWNRVAELPAISSTGALRAVCLDAGAEKLVTVTESDAQIWNARTGQSAGQMAAIGPVTLATCSADGTLMFTASGRQGQIRNAMTGAPARSAIALAETPSAAVFDAHNHWLAVVSPDELEIWDAATGQPKGNPIQLGGDATDAVFSSDGSMVATWSHGGTVRVWDVASGAAIGKPMIHQGEVKSTNFSLDGKLLVASSTTGHEASLWTVETDAEVGILQLDNWVFDAELSPDGRWVATSSGRSAQVWDVASKNRVSQLMQEKDTVLKSTFSPNSEWVLTASQDGVAQLWDASTGVPVGKPMIHTLAAGAATATPLRASFSADGKWVFVAWEDESPNNKNQAWEAKIWEAPVVAAQAPSWLSPLAEAAGGLRLDDHGVLQPTPEDEDPAKLRDTLRQIIITNPVERFGRWLATDPQTRDISPN
jgi:WD40 repeat protein